MMRIRPVLFSLLFCATLHAQDHNSNTNLHQYLYSHAHVPAGSKPLLDFEALDHWPMLPAGKDVAISADGHWFAYGVSKRWQQQLDSLIVQSTTHHWRLVIPGARAGFFSADSKQYIYQTGSNLCFVTLGTAEQTCLPNVSDYKLLGLVPGKYEWLAIRFTDNRVVLQNLLTGQQRSFEGVGQYSFSADEQWLFCWLNNSTRDLLAYHLTTQQEQRFPNVAGYSFVAGSNALLLKRSQQLEYASLLSSEKQLIWQSGANNTTLVSYAADQSGRRVALVLKDSIGANSLWYWQQGRKQPILKVSAHTPGMATGLQIKDIAEFWPGGRYIQFVLQSLPVTRKRDNNAVQLDIWSYHDDWLQSTQMQQAKQPVNYLAVYDLLNNKVWQLENESVRSGARKRDYVILSKKSQSDQFWRKDNETDSSWLLSLSTGKRTWLPTTGRNTFFYFSPSGRYLIYFNGSKGGYYCSYDVQTDRLVNISQQLPAGLLANKNDFLRKTTPAPAVVLLQQVIAWVGDNEWLLVSNGYDLWLLDITGKRAPVAVTNSYGRKHHIQFEISGTKGYSALRKYKAGDTLILKAYHRINKQGGYYRKILLQAGDPVRLSMGPYCTELLTGMHELDGAGMPPVKAADANAWIVKRETATQAPNYFITHDFTRFRALTQLQPQQHYNWLTAELHSFRLPDGTLSQGILYKPENFDPAKKYPVIISFYARVTDQLYQFPSADYITNPSIYQSPAWMVSHGYLVFVPDLYFIQGNWGPSTLNSIEGAAKYVKRLAYVDARHIAAAGHSNSGRFGYYLLTHSKSFACMALGSGHGGTDYMSTALSVDTTGWINELEWAERGAYGAGGLGNLWENKPLWLDHIAVLRADKVVSPLLLFHNKADGDDVRLAAALFIALRRLDKVCWWLQYDEGSHSLGVLRDQRDFTIRYTQFFDFFLKGAPAPKWMREGVPYKMKGVDPGYELNKNAYSDGR